ncbi:hypothetical protein BD749_0826 [Pontibacter ramchanderi]|uniref:Uncharacterized protein n=1 Tax=Pontibacter ramchanderi TaxID=1179743 RepID=A0A2N3V2Q0_9BACT|nr:hypothetical protein BD749_0826 [Pontibacter ramchanderi]
MWSEKSAGGFKAFVVADQYQTGIKPKTNSGQTRIKQEIARFKPLFKRFSTGFQKIQRQYHTKTNFNLGPHRVR